MTSEALEVPGRLSSPKGRWSENLCKNDLELAKTLRETGSPPRFFFGFSGCVFQQCVKSTIARGTLFKERHSAGKLGTP